MITSYYYQFCLLFNFDYFIKVNILRDLLSYLYFILNYPIFLLFGLFFFFTTIFSLAFLSYLGLYGVFWLNLTSLFLLWLSFVPYLNFIFKYNNFFFISLGKWMYLSQNYKVSFDFFFDNISFSFSFLTLTIAVFVYIYTFSYFRYEPLVERLVLFLNSFIISMVFLVSSGNFIMLFLGWEMIGLTSFLLINFWSTRVGTLKAAFKAYSFNKVSDFFLFFAILLVFNLTYTLDIITFLSTIEIYNMHYIYVLSWRVNYIEVLSLFLIGSAFIKSAQFGAHIWLPDSMEAPVPASALIHSATLVSAGIYLLLRFNNLFDNSSFAYLLIALVGSFTALYGGLTSMFQSDVKRILAYSTISHCGFLMVMYTTGILEYVVLYLYIHGFFKAATFLCVGNIIRFSRNIQDYKRMGFFYKYLPFEAFICFICLINLGGLPLTLGFYSKHLLLLSLNNNFIIYYVVLVNCILAALTGLYYSSRLYYYVFFDFKKSKKTIYLQALQNNLNSKYYSNTTLISNIAISGLVITSYAIILYLFSIYISNDVNFSDFSKGYFNIQFIYIYLSQVSYLNNLSYLNWVIILLGVTIIFSKWRFYSFSHTIYINFFSLLVFSFFFYNLCLINIFFYFFFMWGNISTEASYQLNFNVGFSTTRSDVLVHLAQWQYWWWFWFALVWSFYYLIMLRVIRFRVLKMRPKISTSYRPHGKWGDFLACIIPMIWCINILSNSNFILRLIEWQNESSLFTVRVRARQWYWIYKFELKTITDILTAPKNIGNNKWQINTFGELQTTDDYLHILQLRAQNRWVKKYWSDILSKSAKIKKYHLITPQETFNVNKSNKNYEHNFNVLLLNNDRLLNSFNFSNEYNQSNINFFKSSDIDSFNKIPFLSESNFKIKNLLSINTIKKKNQYINGFFSNLNNINNNSGYFYPDYIESTRWNKRGLGVKSPVRLIKNPNLSNHDYNDKNYLLRFRFNLNKDTTIEDKQFSHNPYLVLKQKKYKKKKTIPLKTKYFLDDNGNKTRKIKYTGYPILLDNKIFDKNIEDPNIQYRMVKKAKLRNDLIPVTLARRILRTKKTLVLPAHINITLITNSYDIVHSWFIPGLGIKLDCVPGRSTHHTFFIDNVGFYYGQCAEICGRYHHHMPIRVCALPFEHFLVWWHNFGLPRLLFSTSQKRYETYYSFRKYVW